MYAIIIGAGRIGRAVARWLIEAEHEIVIIDRSSAACATAEEELGSVTVLGDATEAGVLAKAGINRADILIAATHLDDVNMVTCQLAKHRFGVSRIVVQLNDPEYKNLFDMLELGTVISITDLVVGSIQEELGGLLFEQIGELG